MSTKKSQKKLFILVMMIVFIAGICLTAFIANADTYYTIRIDYKYKDGSPAHDSYIAVYPANEEIDLTVTNPKIDGFAPMTAASGGVSAATTSFSYESFSENVTQTVYYVAGLTHYKAIYYKQNIYDDLYTKDNTLSSAYTDRYGYTGTNPTDLEDVSFTGFTNLFHEPDAIAADGSTEFRVYYDRNYYSVNFDLGDGGYGVEPIYAKYQSSYHIPEPKRKGYIFLGWVRTNKDGTRFYDENNVEIQESECTTKAFKFTSGEIPASDTYYKALWEQGKTSYSVVYWIKNPDSNLTADMIEQAHTRSEAQQIIAQNYSVIAAKDVWNVTSGTHINLDTVIKRADGTDNPIKNFFGFNLKAQGKRNNQPMTTTLSEGDPLLNLLDEGNYEYPVDKDGVKLDFPSMSEEERNEFSSDENTQDKQRYFIRNDEISSLQFSGRFETPGRDYIEVSGDGSTRINVYYDRKEFTLKFFYAKTTGGTVTETNGEKGLSGGTVRNV